jgi:transcriptional regulator with XRE-family HTH domain
MTPDQFRAWRKTHGFTQGEAADALGLGKRTVATYENEGPIPKHVALACAALTLHFKEGAGRPEQPFDVTALLKEQNPDLGIGETALVLPFEVKQGDFYKGVVEVGFSEEVREWLEFNKSSAKLSIETVTTPNGERAVAIVSFGSVTDAVHFKLRWWDGVTH